MGTKVGKILKRLDEMAIATTDDNCDFNGLDNKLKLGYQSMSLSLLDNAVFFDIDNKDNHFVVGQYNNKSNDLYNHWMLCEISKDFTAKDGSSHYIASLRTVMKLEDNKISDKLGYGGKSYRITAVKTLDQAKKNGYGSLLYRILMSKYNFTLVGDMYQYLGARMIWFNMSKHPSIKVDLIDLNHPGIKLLEEDIDIKSPNDPRVWTDEELYDKHYMLKSSDSIVRNNPEPKRKLHIAKYVRTVATCNTLPENIKIIDEIKNYVN